LRKYRSTAALTNRPTLAIGGLFTLTQPSHDECTRVTIESPGAEYWQQRVRWRATAACAALVALLFAAPLSRGYNTEPPLPSNSYTTELAHLDGPQAMTIHSSAEARALAVLQTRFANPHCGEIIARIQLGEPLLKEERTLLRNECPL
jgi:hypothetical protein